MPLERFVQPAQVVKDVVEDDGHVAVLVRQYVCRFVIQYFDLTDIQPALVSMARYNPEPLQAERRYAQQSVAALVPVGNPRQRANIMGRCRPGLLPFPDEQDSEWRIVPDTIPDHADVPWLEYPEWQRTTRKQHDIQRKQRNLHGGSSNQRCSLSIAAQARLSCVGSSARQPLASGGRLRSCRCS